MKTVKARVESAILDDNSTGIFLTYTDVTDCDVDCPVIRESQHGVFVPLATWGQIPPGKSPKIELQKIADLFNGIERNRGRIEAIQDWKPKVINIEIEG